MQRDEVASSLSQRLIEAIKLASERQYRLAQRVGLHPSTLSRWINGIESVRVGDPRVIRLGQLLGLRGNECFEGAGGESVACQHRTAGR